MMIIILNVLIKIRNFLKNSEEFVSKLNIAEIAKAIKNNPVIHVFYEWNTLPTAIDIESKFVESGIANFMQWQYYHILLLQLEKN